MKNALQITKEMKESQRDAIDDGRDVRIELFQRFNRRVDISPAIHRGDTANQIRGQPFQRFIPPVRETDESVDPMIVIAIYPDRSAESPT